MFLWVHSDSDHPQWELDILSKSSPALFRRPHCRWTPVWLSECLTRKSWYPACMEMDNCCCCSFYLHIHLFATPTTWHLVWYHVECRDIHASSHTQDWCPATLWFWLLVWIIILQRHIFLDYLPPLSLIEETFRLCWQFAKQNQEANRLAMETSWTAKDSNNKHLTGQPQSFLTFFDIQKHQDGTLENMDNYNN